MAKFAGSCRESFCSGGSGPGGGGGDFSEGGRREKVVEKNGVDWSGRSREANYLLGALRGMLAWYTLYIVRGESAPAAPEVDARVSLRIFFSVKGLSESFFARPSCVFFLPPPLPPHSLSFSISFSRSIPLSLRGHLLHVGGKYERCFVWTENDGTNNLYSPRARCWVPWNRTWVLYADVHTSWYSHRPLFFGHRDQLFFVHLKNAFGLEIVACMTITVTFIILSWVTNHCIIRSYSPFGFRERHLRRCPLEPSGRLTKRNGSGICESHSFLSLERKILVDGLGNPPTINGYGAAPSFSSSSLAPSLFLSHSHFNANS